jgi:chemotaxis protein methyltransferase CheR
MSDPELVAFLQWGLLRLGLWWQGYRKVWARIRKNFNERFQELELSDIAAYRDRLETHPQEWAALDALCRITISRFHRDRDVFDHLRRVVLPGLAERASEGGAEAIRCWSADCASGEEPYTLRILWERGLPAEGARVLLRVVATDIDEPLLERAREGRYPASSLEELPRELLETAFVRDGELFRVRDGLRSGVEFHRQDIREAMPEGPFDLVLCRNLAFTYFDEQGQREVLQGIDERLVGACYLIVRAHESLPGGIPLPRLMPHPTGALAEATRRLKSRRSRSPGRPSRTVRA